MNKRQGFMLFTVVILLLLLTIITISAMQMGVLEERTSRNRYESETTFLENENAILKTTACFLEGQDPSAKQNQSEWCQKVVPSSGAAPKTLSGSDAPLMKTDEGLIEKYVLQFLDFEKSAPKPVIVMPSPAKAAAPATAIEVPVAVWKKEQNKNGAVKDPQKFCPAQATCTTATIFPSLSGPNNPLPYGYAIIAGGSVTVASATQSGAQGDQLADTQDQAPPELTRKQPSPPAFLGPLLHLAAAGQSMVDLPFELAQTNTSGGTPQGGGNDAKTTIAASVFYTGSLDKSLTVNGSAIKGSIKCGNNPEESYCLPELEKIQDKNFLKQYIEALQKKYPDRVHINDPLPGADSDTTKQNKDGAGSGLPNPETPQSGQTSSGAAHAKDLPMQFAATGQSMVDLPFDVAQSSTENPKSNDTLSESQNSESAASSQEIRLIDLQGDVYYSKQDYTLPEGAIFYNGTIISEGNIIANALASGGFCPGDEPIVDQAVKTGVAAIQLGITTIPALLEIGGVLISGGTLSVALGPLIQALPQILQDGAATLGELCSLVRSILNTAGEIAGGGAPLGQGGEGSVDAPKDSPSPTEPEASPNALESVPLPLNLIAAGNIEYHLPGFSGTMVAGVDVKLGPEVMEIQYPILPANAPRIAAWRRDYHLQDQKP